MLPFSLFLALKYLKPKRTFLSAVTVLSVMGVMLGVAVLVIVLSVMEGFDRMWADKILSFNAHVTIALDGRTPAVAEEKWCEWAEGKDGVKGASPAWTSLVFVPDGAGGVATPLAKGVDPDREGRTSRIPECVTEGEFSVADGDAVLGSDLARRLGLAVGDEFEVYSPATFLGEEGEMKLPKTMRVAGIFELGMWEYDSNYLVTGLWDLKDFCGGAGWGGIQVMLDDPYAAAAVAARFREERPWAHTTTWMEQNRQLFEAVRTEKNMMFFLLLFITVVAAFGITNTLITVTVQKTREIGLLRALGFSGGAIMRVFFWQGWVSGVAGTGLGVGLGLLALKYRNALLEGLNRHFGMDLLPKELYQLPELPAATTGHDVAAVALAVLGICTLAAVIPAWRAARLKPVEALRYE